MCVVSTCLRKSFKIRSSRCDAGLFTIKSAGAIGGFYETHFLAGQAHTIAQGSGFSRRPRSICIRLLRQGLQRQLQLFIKMLDFKRFLYICQGAQLHDLVDKCDIVDRREDNDLRAL